MKRYELQAEVDRLSAQLKLIRSETGKVADDLVVMSSQQLCVSICGSLEQTLKRIFVEYGRQRSGNQIHRSIEKVCESYQNPKSTKVLELIGLFDDDFQRQLRADWEGAREIEKQHLDNLVDDRITIAHRKRVNINVTSGKLQDYLKVYVGLTDRIFEHFLNP